MSWTYRTRCGGCDSPDLKKILELAPTPPANTLPTSPGQQTSYPLELAVCTGCWLVQQLVVVPDAVLFNDDYGFYSGASLPKVAYHQQLAARLYRDYRPQATRLTVEVGCNDGDLLRHFHDVGCQAVGIDPAKGPAEAAITHGLNVLARSFGRDTARQLVDEYGRAGLVIANHVAAHVADLDDLFGGFDVLLADDGVLSLEVQYLVDLLVGNQLDHVYHEHRYHFSVSSLANVARRYGLVVVDVRHTPAQSGSVSVTLRRPADADAIGILDRRESWLRTEAAYAGLQGTAEYVRDLLVKLITDEYDAGRRLAGYAAPAKATTLLNYAQLTAAEVAYVVDTTPHKHGRYVPGTDIPIVGREWDGEARALYHQTKPRGHELPDTWLLLAHNYLGDVLRREWEFTAAGGRWLVPIPVPVLL